MSGPKKPRLFLSHYKKGDYLGQGANGAVKSCTCKTSGLTYAVKITNTNEESSNEIRITQKVQGHPNVVQLHDTFQQKIKSFLVMEIYAEENLREYMHSGSFHPCESREISLQILKAVVFIHDKQIVHRGTDTSNIKL